MTRFCGATSEGARCTLEDDHPDFGVAHLDAEGRRWPSHVAAPGGVCIPDPSAVTEVDG